MRILRPPQQGRASVRHTTVRILQLPLSIDPLGPYAVRPPGPRGDPGPEAKTRMLRTRSIAAAVVTAALAGVAIAPLQAQAATGSVHLYKIYYDSPGTDKRSAASLNAEYVQVKNTTSKSVSLKGWTLTDAAKHKYTFGTFTLAKGKTVTIRTGKGKNSSTTRYQGSGNYIWNNDKDTATLRKPGTSKAIDTCSYNSTKVDYKMC
jgi:lamin tail-like protein